MIPLGADPVQFSTQHFERDIDILGAGSLIPLKQYDIYIDVVFELKKKLPCIKTMICGNGPEHDKLRSMIEERDMQSNITLAGEISHDQVLKLMQRSKIFLHPSNYEGYGTVCLEALCAGAHGRFQVPR